MNRLQGASMAAAAQRRAERQVERGRTRAWLFDWRPGEVLRDDAGALYEIVEVPLADRHDLVVTLQKMVVDGTGRPLHGLREGKPFFAVAGRDGVRLGQGRWARRVAAETAW
jgi:hypothetical protein